MDFFNKRMRNAIRDNTAFARGTFPATILSRAALNVFTHGLTKVEQNIYKTTGTTTITEITSNKGENKKQLKLQLRFSKM